MFDSYTPLIILRQACWNIKCELIFQFKEYKIFVRILKFLLVQQFEEYKNFVGVALISLQFYLLLTELSFSVLIVKKLQLKPLLFM